MVTEGLSDKIERLLRARGLWNDDYDGGMTQEVWTTIDAMVQDMLDEAYERGYDERGAEQQD